jgi:hypothetical protein
MSNGLTPAQSERYAKLAEELSEAGQVLGKIWLHGLCPSVGTMTWNNREDLEHELGDIEAAKHLLLECGDLSLERINHYRDLKIPIITRYMVHQSTKEPEPETPLPPLLTLGELVRRSKQLAG